MSHTDPVRFGVLGVGRIARNRFAPAILKAANATLFAAASRDLENARALGAERSFGDYQALLDDPDVEAVYIATHNGLHEALSVAALERGKHVLCEKPLGRNAAECERMIAAAKSAGRHLVEAFMYRHHPHVAKARELVDAGVIGDLRVVEASFSFTLTSSDDVRLNKEWGGGGLLDVGSYCVNLCRLFLGDTPRSVVGRSFLHPEHGVDMGFHGILDYGAGRFGIISSGFDCGLRHRALLSGTKGILRMPEAFLTLPDKPTRVILEREEGVETITCGPADTFQLEIEDLAAAIRNGRDPALSPYEGLHNARVLDALLASPSSS